MKTSIVTCVKNEGRYLLEWIAWSRLVGFDDIAIYDNGSTDGTRELLTPLANAGLIRLCNAPDVPGIAPQLSAFQAELRWRSVNPLIPEHPSTRENGWTMFADPDEFLVIRDGRTIGQFLASVPREVVQVVFNWRLFGSSGHVEASTRPVIERFTMASTADRFVNRHVKAITRRSQIESPTIHAPILKGGLSVHDDMQPSSLKDHGVADRVSHAHAYLNHYIVKSRAEFDEKIARGRGSVAAGAPNKLRPDPEKFWQGHNANDVECLLAKSRLPAVAGEIFRMGQWCDWWRPTDHA